MESSAVEALRPTAPFFFGQFGELVGDDVLLGLGLASSKAFLSEASFAGILADALAELGIVGGVGVSTLARAIFSAG